MDERHLSLTVPPVTPDALSPRQREVVALIAEGLSNAEIARRLTVVEGTVANHVEHILRKLTLRSRTQVAVWAVEHGLYRSGQGDDDLDGSEPPTMAPPRPPDGVRFADRFSCAEDRQGGDGKVLA